MKTVTVTCSKGRVQIATQGFAGNECIHATKALKSDLGFDTSTGFERRTTEASQSVAEVQNVKQR